LHLCIISGFRWQSSNSDTFGPCRRAFRFAHGPVYIQSLDRSFIAIQFDYGGKRHLYRTLDCNEKKYYFCTVEQSRMNHDRTYRPVPYVPAPRLRGADGSMRQAPCRSAGYAATHPVPPLKGLPGTRATDVSYRASVPAGHAGRGVALSYRALAPGGAGFYRICTGTSESRLTAHYSLLTANSTYTFSAKEKDLETGLSYFGSRYYSSDLSVWLSVDPMASKYPSLSPYVYCKNSPIVLFDPDGEDAVYIAFPDYKITVGKKQYKHLGHAGVLLIDNKTGLTKYYEYGRYDKEGKGKVRKITISNVTIGKDGKPTQESLNKVLKQISNKAGQKGKIEGAYVESDKFKEMDDYAKQRLNENSDPKRRSYQLFFNNCGTFADDVIKQDSEVKKKAPVILDPRPVSIIKEYQKKFTKITYDPIKE